MRDAIRAYKRLTPRAELPHPLKQVLDNHEAIYWTVLAIGICIGVGGCMFVLSWTGRLN